MPTNDAPTPTHEQLQSSPLTEKRTVEGELRYYVKDLHSHLAKLGVHPDSADLQGWFTPDGKFHAQGVAAEYHNALLGAMMIGAAG